jgi:hypothetical protein
MDFITSHQHWNGIQLIVGPWTKICSTETEKTRIRQNTIFFANSTRYLEVPRIAAPSIHPQIIHYIHVDKTIMVLTSWGTTKQTMVSQPSDKQWRLYIGPIKEEGYLEFRTQSTIAKSLM